MKTPKLPQLRSMQALMSQAHPAPVASAPKPAAIPMPKAPKMPKLQKVSVTHHYATAPSKQFTFRKPDQLAAHIKKIQNGEWSHPNVNRQAGKIDRTMDIG